MSASHLFRSEYLSVVLAGRLAQGCRAARSLLDGPWTVEEVTERLAAHWLDTRTSDLHWTDMQTAAGPVDVFVQPDGPGTRRHRVPGVRIVARVPFSGTPDCSRRGRRGSVMACRARRP